MYFYFHSKKLRKNIFFFEYKLSFQKNKILLFNLPKILYFYLNFYLELIYINSISKNFCKII